jgi:t-SNARE complex subunit (syntaxin)
MDSENRDILEPSLTLEEGLRRSQLRSMRSVNKKFGEVESIYRKILGESVSQQEGIDSVEATTLKTALLTDETVNELQKAKKKRDRRLKFRLICIGLFLLVLIVWLGLVIGLRRTEH